MLHLNGNKWYYILIRFTKGLIWLLYAFTTHLFFFFHKRGIGNFFYFTFRHFINICSLDREISRITIDEVLLLPIVF